MAPILREKFVGFPDFGIVGCVASPAVFVDLVPGGMPVHGGLDLVPARDALGVVQLSEKILGELVPPRCVPRQAFFGRRSIAGIEGSYRLLK